MRRISMIDPANATGKVKDLLDSLKKSVGRVPNIFRVIARSPAATQMFFGMRQELSKGAISGKVRDSVSLLCAEVNKCHYCLAAHSAIAKSSGVSEDEIEKNKRAESNDAKTTGILRFSKSVLENRGFVTDEELGKLKSLGVSEEEIVELIALISLNIFTNYINTVANTEVDF